MSRTGVLSIISTSVMYSILPQTFRRRTVDSPIEFGRAGDLVAKTPRIFSSCGGFIVKGLLSDL